MIVRTKCPACFLVFSFEIGNFRPKVFSNGKTAHVGTGNAAKLLHLCHKCGHIYGFEMDGRSHDLTDEQKAIIRHPYNIEVTKCFWGQPFVSINALMNSAATWGTIAFPYPLIARCSMQAGNPLPGNRLPSLSSMTILAKASVS